MASDRNRPTNNSRSVSAAESSGSYRQISSADAEALIKYANSPDLADSRLSSGSGYPVLSPFQKRLLAQTWQQMAKYGPGGIANVVYQKFLSKRPEVRQMLTKADVVSSFAGDSSQVLPEHAKLLIELLDQIVSNLDDLSDVGQKCIEIGKDHAHLENADFTVEYWDKFGQSMLESFTQLENIRKHKELVKAWMQLIAFVIDKIRQGYTTGIRRQRFQQQKSFAFASFPIDRNIDYTSTSADSIESAP